MTVVKDDKSAMQKEWGQIKVYECSAMQMASSDECLRCTRFVIRIQFLFMFLKLYLITLGINYK